MFRMCLLECIELNISNTNLKGTVVQYAHLNFFNGSLLTLNAIKFHYIRGVVENFKTKSWHSTISD